MPRANNQNTTAHTPINELQDALDALQQGQKISCPNTKEEILRTQKNLTQRRHEIPGADSHLEYIEALLMAEARGKLQFKD